MSVKSLSFSRTCAAFCAWTWAAALAAPTGTVQADDLARRYDGLERCMARTLGAGWQERYQIHTTINRWGRAEPNGAEIDAAPQTIRVTDLQCRRQLGLSGSARPDDPDGRALGAVAEGFVGAPRVDHGALGRPASPSSVMR